MNAEVSHESLFLPWHVHDFEQPLGFVSAPTALALTEAGLLVHEDRGLVLLRAADLENRLDAVRDALERAGLIDPPRGERMPVWIEPQEEMLCTIDRSAMRILGLWAVKVHVNGLVPGEAGPEVWLSRRSLTASAAPGLFDTLVAGGQPAQHTARETMIKEAYEEVGIAADMAEGAQLVAQMPARYSSPQGYHRELLAIFDLALPESFRPLHRDGEIAASFRYDWAAFCALVLEASTIKHSSLMVCRDLVNRYGAMGRSE